MRGCLIAATIATSLFAGQPLAARAAVQVAIDLTHQRMHVSGAEGRYDWPISSARSGFYTPGGSFAPTHLELMHYSRKYHMSPMPHAIFFAGGYAIHGTYSTGSLGRPASHGCVRLSPGNAATLYAMVSHEGARISIAGTPPASLPFAEARRHRRLTSYADAGGTFGYGGYGGYGRPVSYGYGSYGSYGSYGYAMQPYGYGALPF